MNPGKLLLAALAPLAAGCAVVPPLAPLVAFPAANRTAEAFAQDDTACRQEADGAVPPAPAPQAGATPAADPNDLYLRCMTARGNVVGPVPGAAQSYPYYSYPYAHPGYFYATTFPAFWGYYPYRYGFYAGYRPFGSRGYYGYRGGYHGYRGGYGGYRGGYGGYRGGYGGGFRGRGGRR